MTDHFYVDSGKHSKQFTAIAPIICVDAASLVVYRLRNSKHLETFLEELSAMLSEKNLLSYTS
mgnify:CR=1 FL=1